MPTAPIVQTRRALFEYYESVCVRGYANLATDQRLDLDQNLLKSYILEVHPGTKHADGDARLKFLKSILTPVKAEALPSEEDTIFNIKRGDEVLHCDALNDRFWVLHASTAAGWTDRFVDEIARSSASVDVAWFHSDAMEELSRRGEFHGFTSEYDPRPFVDSSGSTRPQGLVLNLRRISGDARPDFEKLRRPGMFLDEIGISSIRIRFGEDGPEDFALADITHSGKFTERGPSFSAHTALIRTALDAYGSDVKRIEDSVGLDWQSEGRRLWMSGSPLGIQFRPYAKFDSLVRTLFSGKRPFRLWGLPIGQEDGSFSVQAVDLHVGSLLRFDISNGYLRLYLPEDSCGNTVTRLLTNVQRHIDARATLVAGNRARVLGRAP